MESKTEKITKLALNRGFYYPAAEIYPNTPGGFWDYGPSGSSLKRKILDEWRHRLTRLESGIEIDGAQILPRDVFKSSGHLESFADPIVTCKKCGHTERADKLLEEKLGVPFAEGAPTEHTTKMIKENKIVCTKCKGEFGDVRKFNLMMKVGVGASNDVECYLRPEACQSIFLDFNRLYKSGRIKFPVGIAQAGKAFRNEISPRNYLLRERELGQMDVEVFFDPKQIDDAEKFKDVENEKIRLTLPDETKVQEITARDLVSKKIVSGKLIAYWLVRAKQYYEGLGIPSEAIKFRGLNKEERAFYSRETWDLEVQTDSGWVEVMACNYRSDYDLTVHAKGSGQKITCRRENNEEFVPHIFELSAGIDRTVYCVLEHAYRSEKKKEELREWLSLPARIAPAEVGVFPLMKKDGMSEKAFELHEQLVYEGRDSLYDEAGSIGKRYARADEIGCPYCITIDYDSLKDGTATLRERDSTEQKRVKLSEVPGLLDALKKGTNSFKEIGR